MRRWDRASFEIIAPDLARGLRAAVVMLVPFYLAAALGRPSLSWTALGGWLGTLADPGGPRLTRARALLTFAVVGALLVACVEPLAASPRLATLALSCVAFGTSVLRSLGGTAGGIGTFLAILTAIASGRVRTEPMHDALFFALGAFLALIVSSILWPVWMHLPVRRSIARVYDELAAYMDAVGRTALERTPPRDVRWGSLVRDHHSRIRVAIEAAREVALSARARRHGETQFGGDVRALLGMAEGQFSLLSALVVELEALEPEARIVAATRLAPLARSCREVQRVLVIPGIRARPPGPRRLSQSPAPRKVTDALALRLARATDTARDLAFGLGRDSEEREALHAGTPSQGGADEEREASGFNLRATLERNFWVLRDALSPRSPFFKHALRTALAAALASTLGERFSPSRVYWVTLTTLAILQPYAGATMKRASERVVGTVLGSVAALGVMMTVRSPLWLSALMIPLSVAAVATRPRSYRLFTLFLTPVFILLAERATGDFWVAMTRAGDALLGGAVALFAGVLVVPASERERLPEALGAALDATAAYAAVVLDPGGEGKKTHHRAIVTSARRAAGIALGAVETSLERFLAEPLRDRAHATDAMLVVTYARRLATALTSFDVLVADAPGVGSSADAKVSLVGLYLADTLRNVKAFAVGAPSPAGPAPQRIEIDPETPLERALARVLQWASLLASVARNPGGV